MAKTKLESKLNQYVADLTVMYTKLHNVHWYVEGRQFHAMHELFEMYYDKVTEDLDVVAERMLQLEFKPVATLKGALEIAKIEERGEEFGKDLDFVEIVRKDFEYLLGLTMEVKEEADKAGDDPTVDIMNEFTAYYQKQLWMIKATLA
ncbi:Dps family protein [Proteiniclasticum ruminis]|uniref:Starvation-inducible DNA-binding protein n=1 Tax=Proteiniclasticum ruminis TaxID=398199 RepID=A0A1G8GBS0_9CLOT|nr:DNA starvation/stationary phase protection protein [Proteiniclasticum ruminis]SDH91751.1 starvation-inducible DNA-binding protein [Proteiniclasticum ruminis]